MAHSKGFSLLELLVTLFILSLVLSLAMPSFNAFLKTSHDQVMAKTILRAIQMARSEAMLRGEVIGLRKNGKSWEQGMLVFVDKNNDGSIENAEQIIMHFDASKRRGILHWRSALARDYLRLLPSGMAEENASYWFCGRREKQAAWGVIVNHAGKARMANETEIKAFSCG